MTSRERIMLTLNHEKADCVPISPRMAYYLMEFYGKSYAGIDSYIDYKKNVHDFDPYIEVGVGIPNFLYSPYGDHSVLPGVEAELEETVIDRKTFVRRKIKTPKGPLEDYMVFPPSGAEYGLSPNPERIEPLVKTADDLERVKYLLPDPRKTKLPNFKAIDDQFGDDGYFMVRPHSGVDHLFLDSLSYEGAMMLYYDDNDLFDALLDLYHDHYKECMIYCLENGAKLIFESWYNCSLSAGWSPAIYEECFLPRIREDAKIAHSFGAMFHFYDDGKIMPLAKEFMDSGFNVMSTVCPAPMGDVDAKVLKPLAKGKTVLNGYVDLVKIRWGNPAEVEEQTKFALEVLGEGGGYMLGTNDSIRDGSPKENVAAFFETGRNYGKY